MSSWKTNKRTGKPFPQIVRIGARTFVMDSERCRKGDHQWFFDPELNDLACGVCGMSMTHAIRNAVELNRKAATYSPEDEVTAGEFGFCPECYKVGEKVPMIEWMKSPRGFPVIRCPRCDYAQDF